MRFNVFNGLSTDEAAACTQVIGHVWVDHLGLTDEEQALRALAIARESYPEYPHPAVEPA